MINGLKIIRTIQSTDRHDAFEAELDGQKVFAKQAKADKPRELLARVPENSRAADRLGSKTDFKFRTPKVIKQEGDWLVTEWIDGAPLGQKLSDNIDKVAEVIAKFLIVFDKEPVSDADIRKTFKSNSLADYMAQKLPTNLSKEQLDLINQAKQLFDKLQPRLVPSWQDGDIRPDHVFADPKDSTSFVLIDPEHFDPRWPRFYSLANNAVKFWVRGPREFSNSLIKNFLTGCGLSDSEIFQPFLANVIVRGISLHWEHEYGPGGQEFNLPRAQKLLKVCLAARQLDDLY